MIIIGPNTQVINFSFAAGGTSEGSPPPPAAVSFDVGGEGFTAQTKASAPRASSYTRRDHERLGSGLTT